MYNTEAEYCTIIRFADSSSLSTSANIPGTEKEDIEYLESTLEGFSLGREKEKARLQKRRINIEKQKLYRRASAKVLYTISIYIDFLDTDLIQEFATVKKK